MEKKTIQRVSEEWPEGWKKQTREVGDLKTSGGRSFMKEEIELSVMGAWGFTTHQYTAFVYV